MPPGASRDTLLLLCDPREPEMSAKDIVDAILKLLEIIISWPVILMAVMVVARKELFSLILKLADRMTKAPGGFEFASLQERVEKISAQVEKLERAAFEPSSALTPKLQSDLQASFDAYQAYLVGLGYKPLTEGQREDLRRPKPGKCGKCVLRRKAHRHRQAPGGRQRCLISGMHPPRADNQQRFELPNGSGNGRRVWPGRLLPLQLQGQSPVRRKACPCVPALSGIRKQARATHNGKRTQISRSGQQHGSA